MARPPATLKEDTHERIVDVAARAIRRSGYDGTSVADIMKEAGLTHGGFYAHFGSRDAMLAEAADRAGAQSVAASKQIAEKAPPKKALEHLMRAYLSDAHFSNAEVGCPIAALGSEMPRQAPEVRRAATVRIEEMIDLVASESGVPGRKGYEQALAIVSSMVGTLILARAVDDPKLAKAFLQAAQK